MITLDTVRADHLGAYGSVSARTPNLDRIADEGVRFTDAWTTAPLTLPAHASVLSGLLPVHHGLRTNGAGRFPDSRVTLAAHFAAAGYRTGAFVGAFVLDRRFGLDRGFERYDDEIPRDVAGRTSLEAERPGRAVMDRALEWLAEDDGRPVFLWVHLYDAHAPYEPPEPFRSRFADSPYDGEIASVDVQVGRLLEVLQESGRLDRAVVAAVGDHGEALGEHGELTHGLLLYEGTLRVPMMVRAPRVLPRGHTVDTPVSLVDLAPTMASLAGRPLAQGEGAVLDGRDLSSSITRGRQPEGRDVVAESRYSTTFGWAPLAAIRRAELKLISAPRPELFRLDSDPEERYDLAGREPAAVAELAAALAEWCAADGEPTPAIPLDAEARARLESLGYLSGRASTRASRGGPIDPKDAVALFRAFEEAHWALLAGRLEEARSGLERLVELDPPNPVFLGQLAEVTRRAGDLDRAAELYEAVVSVAPDDVEARYNLAVTLQEGGRHRAAVAALEEAIRRDPRRPEAHNALGIARAAQGDAVGAAEHFRAAVALDPRNHLALNNLGNVLREMGRLEDAEDAYRRSSAVAPDYADPLNGLGVLEVERGRPENAARCFARVLELAPELHETWFNLGVAYELAGDLPQSAAALREFLARSAGMPEFEPQREIARVLLARVEQTGAG